LFASLFAFLSCGKNDISRPVLVDPDLAEPCYTEVQQGEHEKKEEDEVPYEHKFFGMINIAVPSQIFNDINDMAKLFTKIYKNVTVNITHYGGYNETNRLPSDFFSTVKHYETVVTTDDYGNAIETQHLIGSESVAAVDREIIDQYYKDNPYVDKNKYFSTIHEMLMTNTAPDLFVAPQNFFLHDEEVQGYLVDLYEYINDGDKFNRDDYFMNAIDAFARNSGLYEFPINFLFYRIGVNANMHPDLIDIFANHRNTVNWFDLYGFLNSAYGYHNDFDWGVYTNFYYDGVRYAMPRLIDYRNGIGAYSDINYITLIEHIVSSTTRESEFITWENHFDYREIRDALTEEYLSTKYMFARIPLYDFKYLLPAVDGYGHAFLNPLPYTDEKGNVIITNYGDFNGTYPTQVRISMSKQSKNKDILWEFIKFMTQPEAYYKDGNKGIFHSHNFLINSSISINKSTCYEYSLQKIAIHDYNSKYLQTYKHKYLFSDTTEIIDFTLDIINNINKLNMVYIPIDYTSWHAVFPSLHNRLYEDPERYAVLIYIIYKGMLEENGMKPLIGLKEYIDLVLNR